ncbi:MAG TPA: hypothetical protein VF518_17140, partial [Polyangia bacterium]
MTRTRLVLCLALIGAMGACGGRSGLRVQGGDGGRTDGSASTGDSRRDGLEGGNLTDGRIDGLGSDARLGDGGFLDTRASDGGLADGVRLPDGGGLLDGRSPDGGNLDVRLPDGGTIGSDARDVAQG